MDKKPSEQVKLFYKCPRCGYRAGFLPPSLDTRCPSCDGPDAREFLFHPTGWLNEGAPGWGDDEAMPEDHIPGDKGCRCPACVEDRAAESEWRVEGREDR